MFLSRLFKHARTKALVVLAGLSMTLGVGATISTVAATQQNEVVETKATTDGYTLDLHSGSRSGDKWENNWWTSSIRSSANSWNNLARDTSDNSQVAVKDLQVAVDDCFYGHTWYEWWSDGSHERWEKGFTNNAEGSTWDNSNDGNITCKTAGVYSLYYVPNSGGTSNGWTFVAWGTVTVNLHYVNSSGTSIRDDASASTTSQNNFAAPSIPAISGYSAPASWRIGSSSGDPYSARKITTVTYDLYAVYTPVATYTVTFAIAAGQSGYGSLSQTEITGVNSGSEITVSGNRVTIGGTTVTATPTAAGAQYTYAFDSWSNTAGTVTADRTITASFTRTTNQYAITWKDGNNNTLKTDTVAYGATPAYTGATPTKTATAQYTYTWNGGWSPAIATVTGDATYTATFDSTVNEYTVTWKNWNDATLETDENVPYGTTPTYDGSTPTKPADATYTYTFTGWSPAVGAITGNTTYTAQFSGTRVSYNLTYKYFDADGVAIKDATVTPTANGSTVTLPAPTKDGYSFVCWYESDGFGGTVRAPGHTFSMPTSAKTFTAKFERNGFYLYDKSPGDTGNVVTYGTGSDGTWSWARVTFSANRMFKIRYVGNAHSYEDNCYLGWNRVSSSSLAYSNFQQIIGGDDNNYIQAKTAGTFDIRLVEGPNDSATAIYIDWTPSYTPGYYVVGDEKFNASHPWSVEGGIQLTHETTGGDLAAGTNISIPADASFALTKYVDGHNDVWYNTWASFPDSCETVEGDKGALNLHYKGTETGVFNIYLNKEGHIYIVDQTVIAKAGYIYYASDSAKSAITLTVTNKNSDQPFPEGKHLSDVSDVLTDRNVSAFESKANLYKIPFYNLRGVLVTSEIATIVIGGSTVNVSAVSQSDSKSYYISGSSISEAKGAAAKSVFDLDDAMNGKSICDMSGSWAALKAGIEAGYDGDSGLMTGAKILTCASKGDKKTFETEWLVSDIYKEICRQSGESSDIPAWPVSAFVIPGAPQGNESPLTLTLWIVLGAGILGLGAIGTAYFVSKKKKRHQA